MARPRRARSTRPSAAARSRPPGSGRVFAQGPPGWRRSTAWIITSVAGSGPGRRNPRGGFLLAAERRVAGEHRRPVQALRGGSDAGALSSVGAPDGRADHAELDDRSAFLSDARRRRDRAQRRAGEGCSRVEKSHGVQRDAHRSVRRRCRACAGQASAHERQLGERECEDQRRRQRRPRDGRGERGGHRGHSRRRSAALGDIAVRRKELAERARADKLQPADIGGATFTISNLGMFGVDAFTAIIVPPQAGILAVGAIADRVVAVNGKPTVRPMVTMTLSSDHRVIDGAGAAAFLADVVKEVEAS